MADFLIIRNKCDNATVSTNWIGEGLKAHLESKGHTVTDLSDAQASPEKVNHWLNYGSMRTRKAAILFDHGSVSAFYGEKNNKTAEVITKTNAEQLTKELHAYTLACLTNANNGVGQTAVAKGCYSWLGYTKVVYTMGNASHPYQPFKDCIWSYIDAMADGKTMEQCEAVLRKAYSDRKSKHFVFGYNLDRLLLRKRHNNMTINSHNRVAAKWHNNKRVIRTHAKHGSQMTWAIISGLGGWKRIRPRSADGVTDVFMILCEALANNRRVDVYIRGGMIEQATLR